MFELFLSFDSYGRLNFRIKREERSFFSHNEQIDIFSSLDERSLTIFASFGSEMIRFADDYSNRTSRRHIAYESFQTH